MKKALILVSLIFLSVQLTLAEGWLKDISTAKKEAVDKNRNIILVFQGSDWCAPCVKLDREIWSTKEFQSYASNHFVMLQVDFPRRNKNKLSKEQQEHNSNLAAQYNPNGYFPLVVIMNKNGDILGTTGYQKKSPTEFIEILESF